MSTSILHEKACLLLCTPLINSMGPAILGWKHSIHVLCQDCKRVVLNVRFQCVGILCSRHINWARYIRILHLTNKTGLLCNLVW